MWRLKGLVRGEPGAATKPITSLAAQGWCPLLPAHALGIDTGSEPAQLEGQSAGHSWEQLFLLLHKLGPFTAMNDLLQLRYL